MRPVLLRCVDTGKFVLPDGQLLDTASGADSRENFPDAVYGQNTAQENASEWILSIPAHKCLLTTVPVTKRESALLRKTLPWILEERLLEPAESQHFAIGKLTGESAGVCVINRDWLATVLAELSAAGINPVLVVPEIMLLPWHAGQWSLALDHHLQETEPLCLLRFNQCSGISCSLDNLQFVLQTLLNETADAPESINLFADTDTAAKVRERLPPLLQSRVVLHKPLAWQTLAISDIDLNLLQGQFAPRLPWRHWWRQWRLAAILLIGLLVTDIVATTVQTVQVERAAASVEADIVDLFRSVQPDATIVDPRLQLERAVAALGGRTHEGLTALLERMAPALESAPAIQIQNLDYNNGTGELQLVIVSEGFTAAEELRAQLQNLGLEAELLGSSSEGSRNRSRLRVVI